jgi:rubrerythrin
MLLRNEQQLALNQVETLCFATADHFATAAANSDDTALSPLFNELARQRREFAAELAEHIRALDDLPQQPDPDRETVDNLITSIKAFFSEDQRDTLIDERKKLELDLAAAAQAALQQALPGETKIFLKRLLSHVDATIRQLEQAQRRD